MSASGNPLQVAVYTALTTALGASAPVYDAVPKGAAYPYVQIGEEIAQPWDTMGSFGEEVSFRVHVWSKYPGRKETKTLDAAIKAALHCVDLAVEGFHTVYVRWEMSEILGDPSDGEVRHAVLMFRAVLGAA